MEKNDSKLASPSNISLPSYDELSRQIEISPALLEVVEDVFVAAGVDLVDRWQLEWILRAAIYVDRASSDRARSGENIRG